MRDMRKGEAAEVKWSGGYVWWKVEVGLRPNHGKVSMDDQAHLCASNPPSILHQPTSHNLLTGQSPIEIPDGWI
jgi:hypothetical protein